jgi:RNA polymerase sigma-70 factor (ECF subfamily)
MTGSVIDGEDIVQEALIKAIEAFDEATPVTNLDGWLFRIAHNAALDHLRRRARNASAHADEDLEMIADPVAVADNRLSTAASLRTLMRLPVAQRSSIILADVLGYSVREVGGIIDSSIPSVKAALHRGRNRLVDLSREPEDAPLPALAEPERAQLAAYVDRFNARDFDALRDMLAAEVRLELVSRLKLNGKPAVGQYFHRYDEVQTWQFAPGLVDGRLAILAFDRDDSLSVPKYFVLLEWADGAIVTIRDFVFARYAIDGAELILLR